MHTNTTNVISFPLVDRLLTNACHLSSLWWMNYTPTKHVKSFPQVDILQTNAFHLSFL